MDERIPAHAPTHAFSIIDRIEHAFAQRLFRLAPRTMLWLAGGKPVQVDGLTLEPSLQLMLRARALAARGGAGASLTGLSADVARRQNRRESLMYQGDVIEVGAVHDLRISVAADASLLARHYAPATREPRPLLVFFHGGGFVFGDLDTHDAPCRLLCRDADVHVLSIDYRLAPEHAFPTAADDALAAYRFAVAHAAQLGADPSCIGVAGDSAGGNLSAVVAQQTRGERAPDFALLIYPAVDRKTAYPSKTLFAEDFLLTRQDIEHFDASYFGQDEVTRLDVRLSPGLQTDLRGLCPTTIVTAGFDPLRDEGEAYARALEQAGNKVSLRREPSLIHGFLNMRAVSPACAEALDRLATDLRELTAR
jgi:acetyl esterase